jgi:hypothetical protein
MANGKRDNLAENAKQRTFETMGFVGAIGFCDTLSRRVQPPDAENRMSGGVGGIAGAIPLSPPDRDRCASLCSALSYGSNFRLEIYSTKCYKQ